MSTNDHNGNLNIECIINYTFRSYHTAIQIIYRSIFMYQIQIFYLEFQNCCFYRNLLISFLLHYNSCPCLIGKIIVFNIYDSPNIKKVWHFYFSLSPILRLKSPIVKISAL